jgi:hypothetical protein
MKDGDFARSYSLNKILGDTAMGIPKRHVVRVSLVYVPEDFKAQRTRRFEGP